MKLALLSDTHDLLRPEVLEALAGADAILHAGDVSSRRILDRLREFAPVYAVRGNADKDWAEPLPLLLDFELGGLRVCMAHKKKELPTDLRPYDLVLFGHSHAYSDSTQGRARIVNPGSCGPRRFHQPITMATAEITESGLEITRVDIAQPGPPAKIDPSDVASQIRIVLREYNKGRGAGRTAEKYGIDPTLAEQIIHLYVTHPGVTVEGIMTKMECLGLFSEKS